MVDVLAHMQRRGIPSQPYLGHVIVVISRNSGQPLRPLMDLGVSDGCDEASYSIRRAKS